MNIPIVHIAVVLPARNEAKRLPAALSALGRASDCFASKGTGVTVSLTVALDRTTDNSKEVLTRYRGVQVVTLEAGLVGAARNAGIAAASSQSSVVPEQLWIANTDADSEVPIHWLQRQFELATAGAHMVVGTVQPGSAEVQEDLMQRWFDCHDLSENHPHIHGANLGLRADVFALLGGFKPLGLHEDRDIVNRARALGYKVISTDTCRVETSGRIKGKVNGGFADFLLSLDDHQPPTICVRPGAVLPLPPLVPVTTHGNPPTTRDG